MGVSSVRLRQFVTGARMLAALATLLVCQLAGEAVVRLASLPARARKLITFTDIGG